MIDSELVPWGKGEKQAGEAVEIEPETICLQGTDALVLRTGKLQIPKPKFQTQPFGAWCLRLGISNAEHWATVCLLKNEPTTYYALLV